MSENDKSVSVKDNKNEGKSFSYTKRSVVTDENDKKVIKETYTLRNEEDNLKPSEHAFSDTYERETDINPISSGPEELESSATSNDILLKDHRRHGKEKEKITRRIKFGESGDENDKSFFFKKSLTRYETISSEEQSDDYNKNEDTYGYNNPSESDASSKGTDASSEDSDAFNANYEDINDSDSSQSDFLVS